MTNWASNSYRIEGKQEDLQQIYDLFVKFDKGRRKPFDEQTSKDWEGNIVWALGGETKDYYLRGFIQTCEISEGLLCIEAEEVWGATGFRHFLEKHYQDMTSISVWKKKVKRFMPPMTLGANTSNFAIWLILALMEWMNGNISILQKRYFNILPIVWK